MCKAGVYGGWCGCVMWWVCVCKAGVYGKGCGCVRLVCMVEGVGV